MTASTEVIAPGHVADPGRIFFRLGGTDAEFAVGAAADEQTVAANRPQVFAAGEEGDLVAGASEETSEIASHPAGSDDGDLHSGASRGGEIPS